MRLREETTTILLRALADDLPLWTLEHALNRLTLERLRRRGRTRRGSRMWSEASQLGWCLAEPGSVHRLGQAHSRSSSIGLGSFALMYLTSRS